MVVENQLYCQHWAIGKSPSQNSMNLHISFILFRDNKSYFLFSIDIYHLTREIPASDKSALQCVMEVDQERIRLEKLCDELVNCDDDDSQEQLMDLYERLDEMSADTAEKRAASILDGLGFTKEMQQKKAKDFSGGWRMRIALGIYIN